MATVTGYSDYRPRGEKLSFSQDIGETPESVFGQVLQVCDDLSGVVRPTGYDLWFTCAMDDVWVNVDDPAPSEPYWRLLRQDADNPADPPAGPPATTKRLPALSGETLSTTFDQALRTITCPPGYFVTFDRLVPLGISTRIVDENSAATDDAFPVTLWEDALTLVTTTGENGEKWLLPMSEKSEHLPPVVFDVHFDGILYTTVTVNWTRWLDQGTGEHRALQSAVTSLVGHGWQPRHKSSAFDL